MLHRTVFIAAATPMLAAAVESTSTRALDLKVGDGTTPTANCTESTTTDSTTLVKTQIHADCSQTVTAADGTQTVTDANGDATNVDDLLTAGSITSCDPDHLFGEVTGSADSTADGGSYVASNCVSQVNQFAAAVTDQMSTYYDSLSSARVSSVERTALASAFTDTTDMTDMIQQMFLWVQANVDAHKMMAQMFANRQQGTETVVGNFATLAKQVQDITDAQKQMQDIALQGWAVMDSSTRTISSAINSNAAGAAEASVVDDTSTR